MGFKGNGILHQDVSRGGSMVMSEGGILHQVVSRGGFNGNVQGSVSRGGPQ